MGDYREVGGLETAELLGLKNDRFLVTLGSFPQVGVINYWETIG